MKKVLFAALLLLCGRVFADGGCFNDMAIVTNSAGLLKPSASASVRVCTDSACNTLATIYTTAALSVSKANPITADTRGNYAFCAAAGQYTVKVTDAIAGTSYTQPQVTVSAVNPTVTNITGNAATATLATRSASLDKGFVNAVTDSGAPTNGSTDAATTISNCLTSASGSSCKLPKNRTAISGGSTGTYCDYTISSRVVFPDANGTVLEGVAPSTWSGAVRVCVAAGIGGFRIPKLCYSCGMKNIEVVNTNTWDYTDLTTWFDWTGTGLFTSDGADGIQLLGGSPLLENVTVVGFARHGIYIDGAGTIQASSQPDLWNLKNVQAYNNKAYGVYIAGGDSNAGLAALIRARYNNLGGIYNGSVLGNTYDSVFMDGNTRNAISAGTNKTIAAANGIVVTSNVATITTTTAHSWVAGTWVTTTGSTDTSFNGTCKILTVPLTTTATCNFTHADGNTSNGTAATSSSTQVYAYYTAAGITFGPLVTISNSSKQLFINPYSETSVQQNFKPGSSTFLFGGNQPFSTGVDWTGAAVGLDWANGGITLHGSTLKQYNKRDTTQFFDLQAGDAANQQKTLRFLDKDATVKFCALNDSSGNTKFEDACSAANSTITFATAAGIDIIPKSGSGLRIIGGTSDVTFTGTDFTADVSISSAGLITANGGLKAGSSGSTIADSRELVQSAHSCGTTTTCANTANGSNRIVFGTVPLTSGTPSTATVTGMTAFTSTSSYVCTVTNATNAANNLLKVANASTTSFVITGPNTLTDTINYICIGN